jgi:DNA polymerase-3 subunit delta'
MQFHFAPLPQAEVESILKAKGTLKPAEIKLAAQLSEGSPGLASEMNVEAVVERRRAILRILEHAARGQGFSQLFAATNQLAKDRESSYEDLLGDFYGVLSDLLELSAGLKSPQLRNPHMGKELAALARSVNSDWVMRAITGIDELASGARRNLNRQLGMDALAASLSAASGISPAPR